MVTPIKLSLDEEILLLRELVSQAKKENDKRTILEATKILSRLVDVESKCRERNENYLHRERIMVLGQTIISIIGTHLIPIEGGPELMTLIAEDLSDNIQKVIEQ